jgi:thiamine-monophosphate kinase
MKKTLASWGEFGLIERIRKRCACPASVVKGPGDDCAVVARDARSYQLFTCDMLVEGVDFTSRDDPYLVGRKAVAVSLSDIAACAGVPRYCLVSAGIPAKLPPRRLMRLFDGMRACLAQFGAALIGGDLSRAPVLVLDVSMVGEVEKKNLVLRSGALPGDLIFVTGPLGGTISGKHLDFTPRVREARSLRKSYRLHAMIDISDGLCQDLGHIMKESGVGAVVYERLLPVRPQARSLDDALCAGEDFELLFTVSRRDARRLSRERPRRAWCVGEITSASRGLRLIERGGRERRITPRGFRHF